MVWEWGQAQSLAWSFYDKLFKKKKWMNQEWWLVLVNKP